MDTRAAARKARERRRHSGMSIAEGDKLDNTVRRPRSSSVGHGHLKEQVGLEGSRPSKPSQTPKRRSLRLMKAYGQELSPEGERMSPGRSPQTPPNKMAGRRLSIQGSGHLSTTDSARRRPISADSFETIARPVAVSRNLGLQQDLGITSDSRPRNVPVSEDISMSYDHEPAMNIVSEGSRKTSADHAHAGSIPDMPFPSRRLSPIRNPNIATLTPAPSSSATDAKKIMQLMRITCGRMQGVLSFKAPDSTVWTSGYCAINVASASLVHQVRGDITSSQALIGNLRGCQVRTLCDPDQNLAHLEVSVPGQDHAVHLQPHVPETFDSWLAALLCWQPVRNQDIQASIEHVTDPADISAPVAPTSQQSQSRVGPSATIIKVGKLLMWTKEPSTSISSPKTGTRRFSGLRALKPPSRHWQKVSCTLDEIGQFKIFPEPESSFEIVVPLAQLSRCAIQRLHASVLEEDFTIAIYPKYTSGDCDPLPLSTIYLSAETRVLFEVWFVLLQAFTSPEVYNLSPSIALNDNPKVSNKQSNAELDALQSKDQIFRIQRGLSIKILEAKLHTSPPTSSRQGGQTSSKDSGIQHACALYAEICLEGDPQARTCNKKETKAPFFCEEFEFTNLPCALSSISVAIRYRNPSTKTWILTRTTSGLERGDINVGTIEGDVQTSAIDSTFGLVDLALDSLDPGRQNEKWWPLVNEQNEKVGELLMKLRLDEIVVLTLQDYAAVLELLHTFSNGLTGHIAEAAHKSLKRLSEILLNIFQISGQATAWLMMLVEEEIDTIHKERPTSKFRHGRRIANDTSYETNVQRELHLRDMGKNATIEANLLFRGNSLLTKALDLHMRRVGKEYLEDTLSERMRDIAESDPDCEVDPNRLANREDLQRNWRNLIALTENVWRAISASATRCPAELRMIMRRIRECAEDKYGGFLRTVAYSSVSGFLFLRFFCPAVLNPNLFGLLKEQPPVRAQRTLTLITKTLQTLANLGTFGNKELWMEPMNIFLTTHRPEFKDFVDSVCDISSERATYALQPSYATPTTIMSRLPRERREGFPSLPYLIDQARDCANLVNIWLETRHGLKADIDRKRPLQEFDRLCRECYEKTKTYLLQASQDHKSEKEGSPKWADLLENLEKNTQMHDDASSSQEDVDIGVRENGTRTEPLSASQGPDPANAYTYFSHIPRPRQLPSSVDRTTAVCSPISPQSPMSVEDMSTEEISSSATTDTPPRSSSDSCDPVAQFDEKSRRSQSPMTGIEAAQDDMEDDFDAFEANIYLALGSPSSKRDSAATNKTITAASSTNRHPPKQSKTLRKPAALRRASDTTESSRSNEQGSSSEPDYSGSDIQRPASVMPMHRVTLRSKTSSSAVPRSPSEKRDMRASFAGTFFRKKTRDREL